MPRLSPCLPGVAVALAALLAVAAADAAAADAESAVTPLFRAVTIDDQVSIGYGLAIADVDGDRRPDIVLADKQQIVWYRNPVRIWTGTATPISSRAGARRAT